MSKGKGKSNINSSKAKALLGENNKAGVATSLWGIFTEFNGLEDKNNTYNNVEQLNTAQLHPSFVPIFSNISKKDCSTRLKGLISFKNKLESILATGDNKEKIHTNKDLVFDWDPILSNFTYIYIRVGVYDSDVNVRKLSNECLLLLYKILGGKKFEKYCRLFFPALWLSCNDPKPDVLKSASDCLNSFIKKNDIDNGNSNQCKNKIVRLINHCGSSMFDLYGRILSCSVKSIKSELNANVSSQSEEEELFDRLISISLGSVRKILETYEMNNENNKPSEFSLLLSAYLIFNSIPEFVDYYVGNNNKFTWNTLKPGLIWKFISPSFSSVVRVDAIQLITYSLSIIYDSLKFVLNENVDLNKNIILKISSIADIFTSVINCFGNSLNPNVQSVSPKLLLILSKLFPEIWKIELSGKSVTPIEYFSKTLYLCLRKPNQLSSMCIYLELPQIIASIPLDILIGEFKTSENDYFSSDGYLSEITKLLNKDELYFESLNDLVYSLNNHVDNNSLPLICLLPFTIIFPMIKLDLSCDRGLNKNISDNNDDNNYHHKYTGPKNIFLGASNCSTLNRSIETYYTVVLFILCNRIPNISTENVTIKNFLLHYYSKLIWFPLVFSLTLNKSELIYSSSSNCHKAQARLNEQFSNMMLDSIKYHNWTIEECENRKLIICIESLANFFTRYWSKYYLTYSPSLKGNNIKQISFNKEIYLSGCLTLIKAKNLFFDSIVFIFEKSIIEISSKVKSLFGSNNNDLDFPIINLDFNSIIYNSFLISKFINSVLINGMNYISDKQINSLYNILIENYKSFIQIIGNYLYNISKNDNNTENLHILIFIIDSVFISLIIVLCKCEYYKKSILDQITLIDHFKNENNHNLNITTFVLVSSFIYEKLYNYNSTNDITHEQNFETKLLCELLIDKIFTVFQNYNDELSNNSVNLLNDIIINEIEINSNYNNYSLQKRNLNIEKFEINSNINVRNNIYNLLLEILTTKLNIDSCKNKNNYFTTFIECYIFTRFKYLNEKTNSFGSAYFSEMVQIKDLILEYMKNNGHISSDFLEKLISISVYSNNDHIFDIKNNNSCLKDFIKIVDTIFLYSYIHLKKYYENILKEIEIVFLKVVFGLDLDPENILLKYRGFSITKIIILIERNANMYFMNYLGSEKSSYNYCDDSLLIENTTLEIIINRLSDRLNEYNVSCLNEIDNNFSLKTGFKISDFLRTYKLFGSLMVNYDYDYFFAINPIKSPVQFELNSKSSINEILIQSNLRDIFISKELAKLIIDSNNLKILDLKCIEDDRYFRIGDLIDKIEFDTEEIKYCEYLINKGLTQNCFNFNKVIKNINTSLNLSVNNGFNRYKKSLLLPYYNYIYKLFKNNIEYKNLYIKNSFLYLSENINIENSSQLLEFIFNYSSTLNDKGINKYGELLNLITNIINKYQSHLLEYSTLNDLNELSSFEMFSEYILVILEKFEDNKILNMIYNMMYLLVDTIIKIIKELESISFLNKNEEHLSDIIFTKLNISSTLIKIVGKFIEKNINTENGIIFDNIGFQYEYNNSECENNFSLDVSKVLIGISSTVHYLVGNLFQLFTKILVKVRRCKTKGKNKVDLKSMLCDLSIHANIIENITLDSIYLSSIIYSRINKYCEDIQDELRFSSITIPIEANTIEIYDKILELVSTIYNVTLDVSDINFDDTLLFLLDHILRIKNTEIAGREWIMSISNSNLGLIRGNAMEISRLLTTYSIKLHSHVLIILKEHNWHNVQYEYYDLKSAISSIERFQDTINNYSILKNMDFDDSVDELSEDYDEYINKYNEDNTNDMSVDDINGFNNYSSDTDDVNIKKLDEKHKSEFSSNFEKGIYVIASHWRRLIGPSLSRQLIETYLSALNVISMKSNYSDEKDDYSSGNDSVYMDLSQRLGCWCFMLPKLISNDFVICVDSENPNIKTIEQNLTPCIEFLLELNPLLVGEAVIDNKVDLSSQQKNEFLPSCIEEDDISICQALLAIIKNEKYENYSEYSFELLDDITLKNTTFNSLRDLIGRNNIQEHVYKTFELPLIHVLVELSLQTLVIVDDYFCKNETNNNLNEKDLKSQLNWIELFKHASNSERRDMLVCNLEDILVPDLNYTLKHNKSNTNNDGIWNSNNLTLTWLLATRIVLLLTTYFPRILREIWLCNTNKKIQRALQKLVLNYFSPIIIPIEVNHIPIIIEELSNIDKKITYNHNHLSRTVKVDYSERGFSATLTFTFSECHPLIIPKINVSNMSGISKKQVSNWLISVIKATRYKNVTHAILTWINNISLFLEGVEDCLICYSIVHPQYRSLPRKRCPTCKNIFHSECIYKWFRTSNKTTCPFCISIMH
ncbi:ring domain at very C-terminus of large [Cryptosporidium xiaoi]|uniref:E3 ubiquitin-protein ligase listerin n=1 Tax=Cryptosporidium xiaoi TaxID=659607 RepID=A0AAV9Y2H0_9CRYT